MIKRIIGVLSILSILLVFIPNTSLQAVDAKYDPSKDPAVGTASEDIEKAIQVGKNILATKYNLGGGHGGTYETLNSYTVSNGLDCSSFIAYILMKGAGVGWSEGIPTTYTMKDSSPSAFKKTVKQADWQRGDIILMNNTSHVVMYLGDGYYIGADSTPGVTIRKWDPSWMSYDGYVIRIPDTKTALSNGMIALEADGSIEAGGTTGGTKEDPLEDKVKEFVDDELWKNPKVNFETREYVTNSKGIKSTDSDGFSSNLVIGFKGLGNTLVEWSYIALMAGSAFYFMYEMIVMTIYLAVLPRGTMKINDIFEKVTNLSPVRSNETLLDMLSKMMFSVVIIACLYVNVPTFLYSGFYSILSVLF